MDGKTIRFSCCKAFIQNTEDFFADNAFIKNINMLEPFQLLVFVEMYDRFLVCSMDGIFQLLYDPVHFFKHRKIFELFQNLDGIIHSLQITFVHGNIMNAVIRITVTVIFPFINLNRSLIPEFFTSHILQIELHRASAYKRFFSFVLEQCFGTFVDQIFQRIFPVFVFQAFIQRFVADQGVFIG